MAPRKGSHLRALARKAVAYQKRQWFTNICCICLLPALMVSIAAILAHVIQGLISTLIPSYEYMYCSNLDGMSPQNWPLLNITPGMGSPITPKSQVPGATQDVNNINQYILIDTSGGSSAGPGAGSLGYIHPCVYWLGEDYPYSSLYERNPNYTGTSLSPLFRRDSTYLAEPLHGWLSYILQPNPNITFSFPNYQLRQWSLLAKSSQVSDSQVGSRPSQPLITNLTNLLMTTPAAPFKPANVSNGLLDTIPGRYWFNFSLTNAANPLGGIQPVPYFDAVNGSSHTVLDNAISDSVANTLAQLATIDKSALTNNSGTATSGSESSAEYLQLAQTYSNNVPFGGLYFNLVDHVRKYYSYIMQIGTDSRLVTAVNFPAAGWRQILQQAQLSNAFLRFSNPTNLGASSITQGLRVMPEFGTTALSIPFGSLLGRVLYPFGISFLLPIFVITLVKEKEDRILVMMKMNGLKVWAYYVSHYITMFVLYVLSAIMFVAVGTGTKMDVFVNTGKGVLPVLLLVWGNAQIALAFFFSQIFSKSRVALIVVFLLVLCGVIISLVLDRLIGTDPAPLILFIWPPFAFYRGLSDINRASYSTTSPAYSFSMIVPGNEVFNAIMFLLGDSVVYLFLSWYLYNVIPTEFGIHKPWHFIFTSPFKHLRRQQRIKNNGGVDPKSEQELAVKIAVSPEELQFEDDDVKAEKQRIETEAFPHDSPLILKNMRKVYKGRGGLGPKIAVKDVSFAVESGIVFGLLGPNGAGKTTLISILTGLYEASHGTALLAGKNIKTETKEVYGNIGICPQFDILWDDLTVGEHLYFYARLKGVSPSNEREAVQESLRQVALEAFEGRLTKGLSGGEKRRLSIAIALVGNPAVVFLDEPTTGLDPEVRRLIWNIVNKARAGRTIVLTTHSMEEAEALCQRIGIMAKGTLRCLASPIRLKEKYGSGFRIFFNSQAEDSEHARSFIESVLPPGWKRLDSFATNASYEFPPQPGAIANLFKVVETHKAEARILDWGISQTTLEEVFLRLISENDADAD
ncbi:uncharacterized protein BJ171DRAFT_505933 [Polychytrium aggregatum]|uniref:uncharacterized protein n=1 Tax=Polychytrium aggregatum TaxID=110093 RepID=UPI0022FEA2B8|nr:uncharacterized protein BJ171DRAFT_505933 [Polychytrium aggregatum]KAI9204485.1 hypothetical protein BJ171DRAFT_505933 [Polychytrium aggregatum]